MSTSPPDPLPDDPQPTPEKEPAANGAVQSLAGGSAAARAQNSTAFEDLPPPPRYDSSLGALREILFGRALPTTSAAHQKLPKILALPIFSSDVLSSVAYATEAILGELILAGTGALHQSLGVGIAITLLIVVVSASYRQVIFAYPNGGGAYPVGKENLGTRAAQIAAASLLVDYILTVAVSVASGVDAIGSFSAFIHAHTLIICLVLVVFIMLANWRGVKESGAVFALPSYAFILSLGIAIVMGLFEYFTGHAHIPSTQVVHEIAREHGLRIAGELAGAFLVMQAFSSGCSALTGLEAISNTVPYFQEPRDRNAAAVMVWMAIISCLFFLGVTYLAYVFRTLPIDEKAADYQTIISQISHVIFDHTPIPWFYFAVQFTTAVVLVLAANTAFAGFPQLASMLARDYFLPRQLASVGDRLVYANGIFILAVFSGILLVVFQGNVYELIPLYAVGVFTSFTVAQTGMVRHWLKDRKRGWQYSIFLNALGAVATAIVAVVFVVSKWSSGVVIDPNLNIPTGGVMQWVGVNHHYWSLAVYRVWQHAHPGQTLSGFCIGPGLTPHYGAWIVVVIIPLLVAMFNKIERHYIDVNRQLELENYCPLPPTRHIVIVLIAGLNRATVAALEYAKMISGDVRALHVEIDSPNTPPIKQHWEEWAGDIPLIVLASPFRSMVGPALRYIDAVQRERNDEVVTVLLPETVAPKWWHALMHNQAGLLMKLVLAGRPGVAVANVRYFLNKDTP